MPSQHTQRTAPRPKTRRAPGHVNDTARRTLAGRQPGRLDTARLQEIEDRLLDELLEHHPNRDRALDRLLGDIRAANEEEVARACAADVIPWPGVRPPPRVVLDLAPGRLLQIEQRLVAAVLDRHPNHDRALDHLLDDLGVDPASWYAEEQRRAAFDMHCDNDFDGLG